MNLERVIEMRIEDKFVDRLTEIEIISSENRTILNMDKWFYIYIPMSQEEIDLINANIINPCWRLRTFKNELRN